MGFNSGFKGLKHVVLIAINLFKTLEQKFRFCLLDSTRNSTDTVNQTTNANTTTALSAQQYKMGRTCGMLGKAEKCILRFGGKTVTV